MNKKILKDDFDLSIVINSAITNLCIFGLSSNEITFRANFVRAIKDLEEVLEQLNQFLYGDYMDKPQEDDGKDDK